MPQITLTETFTAPNGVQVPVTFTVYARESQKMTYEHSYFSPTADFAWYIVADITRPGMTDEEFYGGPLAVFEGVCWTGHTMDYHYLPRLNELKEFAIAEIARYLPATAEDHRRVVFNDDGTYDIDDETAYAGIDDEADLRRAEHGTPAYEGWDASDEERIMQQMAAPLVVPVPEEKVGTYRYSSTDAPNWASLEARRERAVWMAEYFMGKSSELPTGQDKYIVLATIGEELVKYVMQLLSPMTFHPAPVVTPVTVDEEA